MICVNLLPILLGYILLVTGTRSEETLPNIEQLTASTSSKPSSNVAAQNVTVTTENRLISARSEMLTKAIQSSNTNVVFSDHKTELLVIEDTSSTTPSEEPMTKLHSDIELNHNDSRTLRPSVNEQLFTVSSDSFSTNTDRQITSSETSSSASTDTESSLHELSFATEAILHATAASSLTSNVESEINRNPHSIEEVSDVYQWSVEDDQLYGEVGVDESDMYLGTEIAAVDMQVHHGNFGEEQPHEVYHSAYPQFRHDNSDNVPEDSRRELRSVISEDMSAIGLLSSSLVLSSSVISLTISPSPVVEPHNTSQLISLDQQDSDIYSKTMEKVLVSSVLKSSKSHNIDDIINGLAHLLGDNVKVANSSETKHLIPGFTSLSSSRINNRGPPILAEETKPESVLTTSEYIPLEATSSDVISTIPSADKTTSESSRINFTSVIPTESSTTVLNTVDKTQNTFHLPESSSENIGQDFSTIDDVITMKSTTDLQNFHKTTKSTLKESVPTGPITEWVPVFHHEFTKPNVLPPIPKPSSSTRRNPITLPSAIPDYKPNYFQPLDSYKNQSNAQQNIVAPIPSSISSTNNKIESVTNNWDPLSGSNSHQPQEEVIIVTANDDFDNVDIVLTATGVMNGIGVQRPSSTRKSVVNQEPGKHDESVYIDGRRQYFTLPTPDTDWTNEEQFKPVIAGNRPNPSTLNPSKPLRTTPSSVKEVTTTKDKITQTTPAIRIDTCIVGDDSTCDMKNREVCRTESGVSSCSCPPGFMRNKNNECNVVISLILCMRIDRFNLQRILYRDEYKTGSPETSAMKAEATQGIDSIFHLSSLAPIYVGSTFNNFYAIGGKLALNTTIYLQETSHTKNLHIKQFISRELLNAIQQRNNSIGNSRLSVDPLFNPIPGIQDVNECADSELNDCSENSECENTFGSFKCICFPSFTDKYFEDPLKSGRVCLACSSEFCNNRGVCVVTGKTRECRCKGNYIGQKCEIDSEVLGVSLGASLAAVLIIILTFICLCMWSRRWKKGQQKPQLHSASPSFTYMDKSSNSRLHTLVSENTLQWFPMTEPRNNYYASEPLDGLGRQVALGPTNGSLHQLKMMKPTFLSRSQTKLIGSDETLNEDQTRFYVPRPKPRTRTDHQNVYSDLDSMQDPFNTGGCQHSVTNAHYMQGLNSYYN